MHTEFQILHLLTHVHRWDATDPNPSGIKRLSDVSVT